MKDENETNAFSTQQEAVMKGKEDLINILKSSKDIDINIDAAQLEKSTPGKPIRHFEVDFDRLIQTDSVSSLSQLVKDEKSSISPLVAGNNVVTIVETAHSEKGWMITGSGNSQIASDLNTVLNAFGNDATTQVTLYEVPNLQLFIYGVNRNGQEQYFMNYNQFSFKEASTIQSFYPVLKEDAARFNKNFGEDVKKGNLVK